MSQMTATAEAAIRSRIGAVSGVQIDQLRTRVDTKFLARTGHRMVEVDVELRGWSCSLHELKMQWRGNVELREGSYGAEQATASANLFTSRIAKQVKRLQQGIAIGHAVPLFSWMPTDEIDVMHLVMDRAAAEMIARRDRDRLLTRLRESVMNLHQHGDDGMHDAIENDDALRGKTWSALHMLSNDCFYHGDRLWVRGALPDTMLIAIVGRRLGDVIDGLPETIANREITAAETDDDGSDIRFAPDNATVQRILEEWNGAMATEAAAAK